MIYGSVCSGIEAATQAWHGLGWRPAFFSEIERFPSAVLAHHYGSNMPGQELPSNGVPNLGDMTKFESWPDYAIDLLVGGTPCQSFSVAGLRKGLDDERGNLMLVYAAIARRYRPKWLVWENVPGVLSDDGGRGFASLLGLLSGKRVEVPAGGWQSAGVVPGIESAYGLAWRVLDAQFVRTHQHRRAVPQRRRRVFVVGHLGSWQRAAAVLFERQSLSGNPPPRREAGKGAAPTLAARTKGGGGLGTDFDCDGGLVAKCLSRTDKGHRDDPSADNYIVSPDYAATLTRGAESSGKGGYAGRRQEDDVNLVAAFGGNNTAGPIDVSTAVNAHGGPHGRLDFESETFVAHTLRADGFDASEDGTGRGTPLVPVAATHASHAVAVCFDETQITSATNRCQPQAGDPSHPLADGARPPTIAFQTRGSNLDVDDHVTGTIGSNADRASGSAPCVAFHARQDPDTGPVSVQGMRDGTSVGVFTNWRVRRLTPTECERLQGFPDGYTAIQFRGKPAADGPRYKALGNSMAVNVMRWIGQRIKDVDRLR